jgi:heme oxygenase
MRQSALLRQEMQEELTLRDSLRQATRVEHDALESGLDLMHADFGMPEYRELLVKYHGFYFSFESFLLDQANQGSAPAAFYCDARCKAAWLAADLQSLDLIDRAGEWEVPMEALHSLFPGAAHQLGAIYVLEGSMLGGRVLSRHFESRFDLTPEHGLRFFSGYEANTATMWNRLLKLLERDVPTVSRAEVISGAKNMFVLLGRQLGVTVAP